MSDDETGTELRVMTTITTTMATKIATTTINEDDDDDDDGDGDGGDDGVDAGVDAGVDDEEEDDDDDDDYDRLFSYIMTTTRMTMTGAIVEDSFDDWTLDVYCDADLNGAPDTMKCTSGGLVLVVCPRGTSYCSYSCGNLSDASS